MAGIEYCIGAVILFIIFAIIFYSRQEKIAARESQKDAEFVLKELDIAVHKAAGKSRLKRIAESPQSYFGLARTYWIGSGSLHFNILRFTFFDQMPAPIAIQIVALSRDKVLEWKVDEKASGIALAQFERDTEKSMERTVLFARTGDGDFEVVFSKKGDIMRLRGGMMTASFNGKRLGSMNLSADGMIKDSKNKQIGNAKRENTSMIVTLHDKEFKIPGPFFVESSFRIVEPSENLASLTVDQKGMLFCIAIFNQAYWRGRLNVR